ncbi:MAG: hypothetical protein QME49_07485 [bacterium]|nr:hypothetical protein [bacterium]
MKKMKKIFFGILAVVFTSGISYAADVQQQDASVGLSVPQIIELVGVDMSETITPGPEDYARDLMVQRVVNDIGRQWGQQLIAARSFEPGYANPQHDFVTPGASISGNPTDELTFDTDLITAMRDVPGWGNPADTSVTSARLALIRDVGGRDVIIGGVLRHPGPGHAYPGDTWIFYYSQPVLVSGISNNTGNEAAVDNAMYDANNDIGKGFAERTAALEMTVFTNAQDGAALYVHGLQPATQQNILRLEDTYVSVCTEKTYILQNDLEGAYANACSGAVMEKTTMSTSSTQRVEDNPRNNYGGSDEYTATMGTTTAGSNIHGGAATDKAYSTWLRIHNQAQHLFEVKMSTKAPRLVVVNLGIANLARYTEGEYTNTLTFTLMPIVG